LETHARRRHRATAKLIKDPGRAKVRRVPTMTAPQLREFMRWDRDDSPDKLHALWLCIAYTGMQRDEAIALRCSSAKPQVYCGCAPGGIRTPNRFLRTELLFR
jgi:integrase